MTRRGSKAASYELLVVALSIRLPPSLPIPILSPSQSPILLLHSPCPNHIPSSTLSYTEHIHMKMTSHPLNERPASR
ncbi:hypothetical protein BDQ12DRAFT_120141 [Crucibulum laeve]|uniref:Uncharacterized protein n=1 Tax=Crucibulum laeve TaxID=68775 RepID=A0A5C3LY61_9AGAR|nr:hypothetical protein BDQ12DRAFT_120141 [Crucibulum laeve]